jgi:hypothetical protein
MQLEQLKNDLQKEDDTEHRDELTKAIHDTEAQIVRLQSQVVSTKRELESEASVKPGLSDRELVSKPSEGDQLPRNEVVPPAKKSAKISLNNINEFIRTPVGIFTLVTIFLGTLTLIFQIIGVIPILTPDETPTSPPTADLMAEVPTLILPLTSSQTPLPSPTLVCGTSHPSFSGTIINGDVEITRPEGDCLEVSQHETLQVTWSGVSDNTYTLWVLVFSPFAKRYYPHACSGDTLQSNGNLDCRVNFAKLNEPYEAIIILADQNAGTALNNVALSGTGILQADLPQGIDEKDSLLARRTK